MSKQPAAKYQVIVTDFVRPPLEVEEGVLAGLATITALDARSEEELLGRIEQADAVMLYHMLGMSQISLARLERCKLIVRCGVGYDNVDRAFARSRGIPVVNIPDYGTEDVADTAIAMLLSLARGTHLLNSRLRAGEGEWTYAQAAPLHRVRGRVFAIVGLGRIGTATALRAKALGMDVVFFDPYLPDGYEKALGIRRADAFDELVGQAHVLSLHCPLTDETRHLVDRDALARLPRGALLINTARGAIVDTSAVPEAVASGQLAGAGIDVLEREPPPADDPLVRAWRDPAHPAHHRMILCPHAAFYSEQGLIDMRRKGAEACRRALLGQPLRNVVN